MSSAIQTKNKQQDNQSQISIISTNRSFKEKESSNNINIILFVVAIVLTIILLGLLIFHFGFQNRESGQQLNDTDKDNFGKFAHNNYFYKANVVKTDDNVLHFKVSNDVELDMSKITEDNVILSLSQFHDQKENKTYTLQLTKNFKQNDENIYFVNLQAYKYDQGQFEKYNFVKFLMYAQSVMFEYEFADNQQNMLKDIKIENITSKNIKLEKIDKEYYTITSEFIPKEARPLIKMDNAQNPDLFVIQYFIKYLYTQEVIFNKFINLNDVQIGQISIYMGNTLYQQGLEILNQLDDQQKMNGINKIIDSFQLLQQGSDLISLSGTYKTNFNNFKEDFIQNALNKWSDGITDEQVQLFKEQFDEQIEDEIDFGDYDKDQEKNTIKSQIDILGILEEMLSYKLINVKNKMYDEGIIDYLEISEIEDPKRYITQIKNEEMDKEMVDKLIKIVKDKKLEIESESKTEL